MVDVMCLTCGAYVATIGEQCETCATTQVRPLNVSAGDLGRAVLWDNPATVANALSTWLSMEDWHRAAAWLHQVADLLVAAP